MLTQLQQKQPHRCLSDRQSVSQFLVVERTSCGSSTAWRSLGLLLEWLHSSLVFHKINLYLVFCQLNVYSRWFCWSVLWHVRSTACLSVLGKGFFLCGSFWGFFHFCFFFPGEFFLNQIECHRRCVLLYRLQSPRRQCDCDSLAL